MSVDKSLKSSAALSRHRNVLRREERIAKLEEEGKWTDDEQPFGLPKVANRKAVVGGKTKKKTAEETTEETKETKAPKK